MGASSSGRESVSGRQPVGTQAGWREVRTQAFLLLPRMSGRQEHAASELLGDR